MEQKIIYEIPLNAERIKGETAEGKKYDFIAFSGYDKNGKKCKFKFTKACENVPNKEGQYLLKVEKRHINKDKSTKYREYWVKEINSIAPVDEVLADNDEDLPF